MLEHDLRANAFRVCHEGKPAPDCRQWIVSQFEFQQHA
jgi:hypothetical protein